LVSEEKPLIVSKFRARFFVLTIILVLLVGLGFYLLILAFNAEKPKFNIAFLGGLVTLLLLPLTLYIVFKFIKIIKVYKDYIVCTNIFGKKKIIGRDNVSHYTVTYSSDSLGNIVSELRIYYSGQFIAIGSNTYSNYSKLYLVLTKKLSNKSDNLSEKIEKQTQIAKLFVVFIFAIGSWVLFFVEISSKPKTVDEKETIIIKDAITHYPQVSLSKNNRSLKNKYRIEISLKSHPFYKFIISGASYEAMLANEFVQDVYENDTLYLTIAKAEFNDTENKRKDTTSYWAKPEFYSLKVYGVYAKGKRYLSSAQYNPKIIKQHKKRYFIILIPILLTTLFVVMQRSFKKQEM
jgi:hypothetical protein